MEIICPHCSKKILLHVDKIHIDSRIEAVPLDETTINDMNQLKFSFSNTEDEKNFKKEVHN